MYLQPSYCNVSTADMVALCVITQSIDRRTALHSAASGGHVDCIIALLQHSPVTGEEYLELVGDCHAPCVRLLV